MTIPMRLRPIAVFALAAATAHADIALTPDYLLALPAGHEYIIGLQFDPAPDYYGNPAGTMVLITTTEAWSATVGSPTSTFQRIFDPNFAGVRMHEGSLSTYDPVTQLYGFTGGLLDTRLYTYSRNTQSLYAEGAFLDMPDVPAGLAVRNGTTDVFGSFGGVTPGLHRYVIGGGDQNGTTFGNTGPGAVSSGVGAIVIGPDGRINVLDTGLQKILRYDAETLAYLDAVELVNTTTDNTAFAISSTGYIFTANTGGASGVIYDYLTGDYVGTFEGMAEGPPPGRRGKLTMGVDNVGNVYVTNPKEGTYVSVFSTSAVPEPATYGLLGAGALAGLAAIRRRKP